MGAVRRQLQRLPRRLRPMTSPRLTRLLRRLRHRRRRASRRVTQRKISPRNKPKGRGGIQRRRKCWQWRAVRMRRLLQGAQVRNRQPLVVRLRRARRLRVLPLVGRLRVLPLVGPELVLAARDQEADRRWGPELPECNKAVLRTPAR